MRTKQLPTSRAALVVSGGLACIFLIRGVDAGDGPTAGPGGLSSSEATRAGVEGRPAPERPAVLDGSPAHGPRLVLAAVSATGPTRTAAPAPAPAITRALQARPQAVAPRFVYASGYQGVGFYSAAPAPAVAAPVTTMRAAPAPRFTAAPTRAPASGARPRSVGPGARNWATGNRVGLHRPWLRARD